MAERHQGPQHVEHDGRADHPIHVQFPEIFDGSYPPLVVLEDVVLQAKR